MTHKTSSSTSKEKILSIYTKIKKNKKARLLLGCSLLCLLLLSFSLMFFVEGDPEQKVYRDNFFSQSLLLDSFVSTASLKANKENFYLDCKSSDGQSNFILSKFTSATEETKILKVDPHNDLEQLQQRWATARNYQSLFSLNVEGDKSVDQIFISENSLSEFDSKHIYKMLILKKQGQQLLFEDKVYSFVPNQKLIEHTKGSCMPSKKQNYLSRLMSR